uniref:ABC1 atypical kinase-like domain-containing protein n=1 Tax=Haptolina brevifila TaxID=156173 RepID=A0A7S2HIP8_9EUKA
MIVMAPTPTAPLTAGVRTLPLSHGSRASQLCAVATGPKNTLPSPIELLQKLASSESLELQRDLVNLAIEQDPKVVVARSLDLARALNTVGSEAVQGVTTGNTAEPAVILRRLCEELGATYVKLGQFIASSPTIFPAEYVAEFQKCLDSTPPMPWSDVKPLIESELGKPIEAVYASIERMPLAAASIAQVHAAKLKTGEDVVIKVQRKGVQGSLKADLDLLYSTSRVLQLLGVVTSELSDVVETLRSAILEEIDFELEATRTEQFATFLARSPELTGVVTVPKVFRQASATRILTLERLYGVSLTDLDSVRQYSDSPELALIIALNTWISSVLTNEWFHADVHAGNLLMLNDGRVAFIDFGIVGELPRHTHLPTLTSKPPCNTHLPTRTSQPSPPNPHLPTLSSHPSTLIPHHSPSLSPSASRVPSPRRRKTADAMLSFVRAYPAGDMPAVAAAISDMGFTREGVDTQAFARDLAEVIDSVNSMPPGQLAAGVVDETQLNRAVAAVGKVASDYGIRFPREFALLIKQVLYFDRYTSLLAPGLDVLNDERLAMNQPMPSQAPVASGPIGVPSAAATSVVVDAEVLPPE